MKYPVLIGSAFAATLGMTIAGTGRVAASADTPPPPSSPKFYATRVTDILNDNCLTCHDETAKGGLRLDSYAGIMKGGADGAVIVPGDPAASKLIQAIRRAGELKMPPKRALGDAEVADLEAWVKA
jgi:cytochrome c